MAGESKQDCPTVAEFLLLEGYTNAGGLLGHIEQGGPVKLETMLNRAIQYGWRAGAVATDQRAVKALRLLEDAQKERGASFSPKEKFNPFWSSGDHGS